MFRVVIPARHASTRFPGKPLVRLAGRTMLEWVWDRARATGASEILIATDDERIAVVAREFGGSVEMTRADHASGTSRIAEVALRRGWPDEAVVVNVQGDEPLMRPALIEQVARLLAEDSHADIATLAAPLRDRAQFLDASCVKVVSDLARRALYFSRAPIPWPRDAAPDDPPPAAARRHLGLYAYRARALRTLSAPAPAGAQVLEDVEKLEQLRALSLGMTILVEDACELPGPDLNSPQDVAAVAAELARE